MTPLTPERLAEIRARLAGWEECESHPSCHGCPHEDDAECPEQCGPEDVRDLLSALDSARAEERAAIVADLRREAEDLVDKAHRWIGRGVTTRIAQAAKLRERADAIEAGAHLPRREP